MAAWAETETETLCATNALSLQQICKTTERARLAPAAGKCKTCKRGGELLACSFCTAVFHNTTPCTLNAVGRGAIVPVYGRS